MPYDTLPHGDPSGNATRWSLAVMEAPAEVLHAVWLGWFILAALAACLSGFVMVLILSRPRLREDVFNRFIVGLAFPDWLFSFCCSITCFSHWYHGSWWGGDLHCDLQATYVMWGFTASIWMNVVIAKEVHRMVVAMDGDDLEYKPKSAKEQLLQVARVYTGVLLFVLLDQVPLLPWRSSATRGLACLPLAYDLESEIFLFVVVMTVMLAVPLALIVWYGLRVVVVMRKLNNTGSDLSELQKTILAFFAKVFAVLLLLWSPTAVLIWVLPVADPTWAALGGAISHCQGIVTPLMYLSKQDILGELKVMLRCGGGKKKQLTRLLSSEFYNLLVCEKLDSLVKTRSGAAAIVAAMIGGKDPAGLVAKAVRRFRSVSARVLLDNSDELMGVHYRSSGSKSKASMTRYATHCALSEIDAFLSHSWHDDYESKRKALEQWSEAFEQVWERSAELWYDKACIDQSNIKEDLECLPIFLAGCETMLIISGQTYVTRLWCVLELFVFTTMHEEAGEMPEVLLLGDSEQDKWVAYESWTCFDVFKCNCFSPEDKSIILNLIGNTDYGLEGFNNRIKSMASPLVLQVCPPEFDRQDGSATAQVEASRATSLRDIASSEKRLDMTQNNNTVVDKDITQL